MHSQYPPRESYSYAPDASDRGMAVLAHLAAILAMVLSVGSLTILGPLILWLLNRHGHPFVRQAAAGAFNFNLSMNILAIIAYAMIFSVLLAPFGFLLLAFSFIATIWCSIRGALDANRGVAYRYPMQLRILS